MHLFVFWLLAGWGNYFRLRALVLILRARVAWHFEKSDTAWFCGPAKISGTERDSNITRGCWIIRVLNPQQNKLVYLHWHCTVSGLGLWAPKNVHSYTVAKCIHLKMKSISDQVHSKCNFIHMSSYIRSEAGTHQKLCHLFIILLTTQRKMHGKDAFTYSKSDFLLCMWKSAKICC